MPDLQIRRGDVVLVNLNPTKGSEQQGDSRPCIVIHNDVGNKNSNTTIIVPVTDASGKTVYPFQSQIAKGDGGLKKASIALCNQIRVISKGRIVRKIGSISGGAEEALNAAISNSLGM